MTTVEFGTLFQFIRNGMSVKQDKSGNGIAISRIETIWNSSIDAGRVGYAGLGIEDCKDWLLENGDILFSHINSVDHIGKCAIYTGAPAQLAHGMNLLCLRCDQTKLLPDFAKYLIRGASFRARLSNYINKAVNQASVSIGNLKGIPVAVPSLTDQRRIAAILDKSEALRTLRREALVQLNKLEQANFLEMFGDPVTNPKNWLRKPISEVGKVITGNTPPRANPANYGNAIEWIKSDNLNNPHYYATSAEEKLSDLGLKIARTVPPTSILVTCIAGSPECIGNSAMVDRTVAFNQQINAFVPTAGEPHFYYAQFRVGKRLIQDASTNGMKGMVSKGRFEKIEIIVPPVGLQKKFVEVALAIESHAKLQRQALSELDALCTSLSHQALHGEL